VLVGADHEVEGGGVDGALMGGAAVVGFVASLPASSGAAGEDVAEFGAVGELVERSMKQFEEALDDDLNTAEALAAIHEFVRETNSLMTSTGLTVSDRDKLTGAVERFDSIFNVFGEAKREMLDAEIDALIEERRAARAARNFERAY
jgi:cysteinyl-tRNA synthetase